MATGTNSKYPTMQYPLASDPVNVHGDIKQLVDALNDILPPLGMTSVSSTVRNASSSISIPAGTPVYISGSVPYGGKTVPTVERYNPSSLTHNPDVPILGLTQTDILPTNSTDPDDANGIVVVSGVIQMNTTGLGSAGTKIYVSNTGTLIAGRPANGPARYIGVIAVQATKPLGGILIVQTKGNGTWGALKDGLS